MPIPRREFLRSGLAAAAVAASGSGCSSLSLRVPPPPSGGWGDLPGILARIVAPQFPARDFVITDFGGAAGGSVDNAPALADAIAACNKAGGGRVLVPGARHPYLVNGPIHLLSNVNLYIEEGAEILFGSNPQDFLPPVLVRYQGIRCFNYSPLIYAYSQSNIALTGAGTLNGQAQRWAAWEKLANPDWDLLQSMVAQQVPVEGRVFGTGHHLRLTMFEPYLCTNVLVQGVTFKASPFWTMHPVFCTNVTIQGVTVEPGITNDDGCDPDSCSDVLIEDCTFTTIDDNVSIKAGFGADAIGLSACENIVIQNCEALSSIWGGYTIGGNTTGDVRNVFIQNCVTRKCQNAYYVKSSRQEGGRVLNIFIRDCQADECKQFFFVESNYLASSGPTPPLFDNIALQNMSCNHASGTAFYFVGDVANPIVYVTLSDIAVGSAAVAQSVSNALFITTFNVTVAGNQIAIQGLL